MTDKTHPITPPPELVREWNEAAIGTHFPPYGYSEYIATQAARWGADQELEACAKWLAHETPEPYISALRAARRPKPPSLKEQALDAWDRLRNEAWCEEIDYDLDFVRRALEQLDD